MEGESHHRVTDFILRPDVNSGLADTLEFVHSFGYDCLRKNNLCVADEHTVVYLSGNYIHVFNVNTGNFTFIPSLGGIGLGHIAKNPTESVLAVGERGDNPSIVLYTYPQFTLHKQLEGGTEKSYNYISFSIDGEWLIAQGGEPDHSLSIWDWRAEKLLLKERGGRETWKAESNPFSSGEIITAGSNHIMFWMTAETFTGLKLKGNPGKFGPHAFCDISAFCPLPKGKVLTPTKCNNIHVWRGGEIIMEVKRSGDLSLHDAEIMYMEYNENSAEIFSVGLEGTFKVWDYSRINSTPKKESFVNVQPIYQKTFQDEFGLAKPVSLKKIYPSKSHSSKYYMQDMGGSIWLVEMTVKPYSVPPKRVLLAHEAPIGDIATSPAGYYFATVGAEGKLHIYSIETRRILGVKKFQTGGTSLLWLPLSIHSSGSILIIGFSDGSVRTVIISISSTLSCMSYRSECIHLVQALKPHSQAVTAITLNSYKLGKPMVLTSSLDRKMFIYWLKPLGAFFQLEPIVFLEMSGPINNMMCSPFNEAILITTDKDIVEVVLPEKIPDPSSNSYKVSLPTRISHFSSVKSQIIRNNAIKRNFQRKVRRDEKRLKHKKKQQEEINKSEKQEKMLLQIGKGEVRPSKTQKITKKIVKNMKEEFDQRRVNDDPFYLSKMSNKEIEGLDKEAREQSMSFLNNVPLAEFMKYVQGSHDEEKEILHIQSFEGSESSGSFEMNEEETDGHTLLLSLFLQYRPVCFGLGSFRPVLPNAKPSEAMALGDETSLRMGNKENSLIHNADHLVNKSRESPLAIGRPSTSQGSEHETPPNHPSDSFRLSISTPRSHNTIWNKNISEKSEINYESMDCESQIDDHGLVTENISNPANDYSLSHIDGRFIIDGQHFNRSMRALENHRNHGQKSSNDEISADEDVPPPYVPPEPSPLFFAKYINENSFWVSVGSYDSGYLYHYNIGENVPFKSSPSPIGDIEITCFIELFNGEYLILGLGNGGIQIVNTHQSDVQDLSDYYIKIMHDNVRGKVKKICATHDGRYLISIGEDGNIFLYKVNLPDKNFYTKIDLPECATVPHSLIINDTIDSKTLSLEESLTSEEQDKRISMAEKRRASLRKQIESLSNRYTLLLELNYNLPATQRLSEIFFAINKDFSEMNMRSFTCQKTKITRNVELEYMNQKAMRNKLFKTFIQPLQTFKIYLFGIQLDNRVATFCQPKLTMNFIKAEKETEEAIGKILKRGSHKQLLPLKIQKGVVLRQKFKSSRLVVQPLFKGEEDIVKMLDQPSQALYARLSQRRERRKLLNNVVSTKILELTLFLEEKDWKMKQFAKDIEMRKEERVDTRYILKTHPDYNLNNLRKITTEKKFYQLVTTKRKIHEYMSEFNAHVLKLREKKSKIAALYNASLKDIEIMQSEFSVLEIPEPLQKINLVEPIEFPEIYFMDCPPDFPHTENCQETYCNVLYTQLFEINKSFPIDTTELIEEQKKKLLVVKDIIPGETLQSSCIDKLWEHEFIEERKQFIMSEYFKKGELIKNMISEYDEELDKLVSLKKDYEIKILYLKLFYNKYFEELLIIRSHQLLEGKLTKKIEVFLVQKHIYILRININNKKIDNCLNDINMSTRRIEKISKAFTVLISKCTSKHRRHLANLFKKKWKPEKIRHEDSSSSEEDDEEDEDEDDEQDEEEEEGEIYIEDLLAMDHRPVDERTKPEGLDSYTFDETFNLRDLRQAEEKRIFEKRGDIQELNDRRDELRNVLLQIETVIGFYRAKLSFVLEHKHNQLSNIRTVAILDASQMQNYDVEKNEFPPVKDTILFPLYNLKNLETRKRKLKEDIVNVQLKKLETAKHVKRLDMDINFLRKQLSDLKSQIKKEKLEKFGVPVNLEKLEETIMKKIIKELKYDTTPFHMKFHEDVTKLEKEFDKVEISTMEHVKNSTYEELKYGALLEQKKMYEKCIVKFKHRKPAEYIPLEELHKNNHELLAVLNVQEERIECLENEIKRLKYISYAPENIKRKKVVELREIRDIIEDDQPDLFEEFDDESSDENLQSEYTNFSKISLSSSDQIEVLETHEKIEVEESEYLINQISEEVQESKITYENEEEEDKGTGEDEEELINLERKYFALEEGMAEDTIKYESLYSEHEEEFYAEGLMEEAEVHEALVLGEYGEEITEGQPEEGFKEALQELVEEDENVEEEERFKEATREIVNEDENEEERFDEANVEITNRDNIEEQDDGLIEEEDKFHEENENEIIEEQENQ